jgi:hypothetical protein
VSEAILSELHRVLHDKFNWPEGDIAIVRLSPLVTVVTARHVTARHRRDDDPASFVRASGIAG